MRFIYSFLFFSISFLTIAAQPQVLRIDPEFATGAPVSQVFESVTFIPLETTKESLFGTVDQLEISQDYFIILDRATSAILLFFKNGTFHTKIPFRGNDVFSFDYEKDENRIRVLSTNNKQLGTQIREKTETDSAGAIALLKRFLKINYFDTDGKSLKVAASKDLLTPENIYSISLPGGISFSNYAIAGEEAPSSLNFELNLYKDGQVYQSYFPYNKKKDIARYGRYLPMSTGFYRSQTDTVIYFTRPLDYSIYQLSPNNLQEKYQLIFPMKNTVPPAFFTDNLSQNARRDFFRENPSVITGLSNIHERKDRLFFKLNNNQRWRSSSTSMLYFLKTGRLISINKLSPDSLSFFLPIFDGPFSQESFKAADQKYFYTYISSLRMFQAMEANASKGIPVSPELEEYFKKGNNKNNPVIVQLTPIINPS